jgi:hypothetical protein
LACEDDLAVRGFQHELGVAVGARRNYKFAHTKKD